MSDKDVMDASRQLSGMHNIAKDIEIRALRDLLRRWHDTYGGSTEGKNMKPVDAALDTETEMVLGLRHHRGMT